MILTQQKRALDYLKEYGSITIRELSLPPFNFNAPHSVIRDLIKSGINIKDDWITYSKTENINGKDVKIKGRYKRYTLIKQEHQNLFNTDLSKAS